MRISVSEALRQSVPMINAQTMFATFDKREEVNTKGARSDLRAFHYKGSIVGNAPLERAGRPFTVPPLHVGDLVRRTQRQQSRTRA